jgi:hypothetical protein
MGAWNRRVDGDALARARPALDDADELVPEHERLREDGVADARFLEPVPVGAAQADGGHAHEHLAGSGRRRRLVVQAEIACGVQAEHLHCWP